MSEMMIYKMTYWKIRIDLKKIFHMMITSKERNGYDDQMINVSCKMKKKYWYKHLSNTMMNNIRDFSLKKLVSEVFLFEHIL